MNLRAKLMLGAIILLMAMMIVMYVVPAYFVRKDVESAAVEIQEMLSHEHEHILKSQNKWLKSALEENQQLNNAFLLMLYDSNEIKQELRFSEDNQLIWNRLARLISYNPRIGFIQAHSPSAKKTAAITPGSATLYPLLRSRPIKEGALFVELGDGNKSQFVAYPLEQEMQSETECTLYALLDKDKFQTEIAELTKELQDEGLKDRQVPAEEPVLWAEKLHLMRLLLPLYVDGFSINKEQNFALPLGIACLNSQGRGSALLSEEIFKQKPLFRDALFYKTHPPLNQALPLASRASLVKDPLRLNPYLANTLKLDDLYLSVGVGLEHLAQELALASHRMIVMRLGGSGVWGFGADGLPLASEMVKELTLNHSFFEQERGVVTIGNVRYLLSKVASLENNQLDIFDLRPLSGSEDFLAPLLELKNRLSGRISLQLILITLAAMGLVLIAILRLSITVINPIRRLAYATQDVASGKYEELHLPEAGNRQDEVATLTRSFEAMVKGLKEREEIRAVLDKVVSKEVADEILRTHIQLGGEDRIVSVLFGDIRGFTTLTAELPPQETIQLLNTCMTKVSRIIEGEGGVIDKYVGDEVMALFGAPAAHNDDALRAVSAGLLIIESLKNWNIERVAQGRPMVEMGIGIHSGIVVAGNMGAVDRLNYTVLGANVNLANRLCSSAKPGQLLISEHTYNQPGIKDAFYTKLLPPLNVKGFVQSIKCYEITGFKWES